jgi:hypothetical protein
MNSFFILGQVPGTGFVISFWMWVEMAALLSTLLIWIAYRRHKEVVDYLISKRDETSTLQTATAQ